MWSHSLKIILLEFKYLQNFKARVHIPPLLEGHFSIFFLKRKQTKQKITPQHSVICMFYKSFMILKGCFDKGNALVLVLWFVFFFNFIIFSLEAEGVICKENKCYEDARLGPLKISSPA